MHPVAAVIYLPSAVSFSGAFVKQCLDHLDRRGYELKALVHEWPAVEQFLRSGRAQVVVFAADLGDDTRDLSAYRQRFERAKRERPGTVNWSAGRVRELIDNSGPIPRGLDPDAIEAARRIARHLQNCRVR